MNTKTLSAQLLAVLRLLESEGSMTARQLNDRLYQPSSSQSRLRRIDTANGIGTMTVVQQDSLGKDRFRLRR